jgi:hypothetical protein
MYLFILFIDFINFIKLNAINQIVKWWTFFSILNFYVLRAVDKISHISITTKTYKDVLDCDKIF